MKEGRKERRRKQAGRQARKQERKDRRGRIKYKKLFMLTLSGNRFVSSLPILSILRTESVVSAKTLPINLSKHKIDV